MDNLFSHQKTTNNIHLFDNRFLSARNLYIHYFGSLPDVNFIGSIDGEKTFNAFKKKYAAIIQQVHQYHWYEHKDKKFQFDTTMILLHKNFLVEIGEYYCYILHDGRQNDLLLEIATLCIKNKEKQRKKAAGDKPDSERQ